MFNVRVMVKNIAALYPCPIFARYTLGFTLQLVEIGGNKISIRIVEEVPGGQV